MARKAKDALKRIQQGNFYIPSPTEVEMAMTPAGSWTAAQLAEWGVAWPPREGWRRDLVAQWKAKNSRTDGEASDFSHVAALLRAAINSRDDTSFKAIMSNNFNIILAALDIAANQKEG